jgi:molybdate transport system permease protein
MDLPALALSLKLAAATTAALLALGLPLGAWLAFSRSAWRGPVRALSTLPLVLPPTVLGFYVLLALGPAGPVGRLTHALGLGGLPFTFTGLLLASILYSLPFAVQPFAAAFSAVDPRLVDAARCLGHGPVSTFFRVVLPLAAPGVTTGLVLCFAHTLGEFGVVLMVGGNIPGATRTLSVAIYDDVQAMDFAAAGRTSLALTLFSFAVLLFVHGRARPPGGARWLQP